MLLAVLRASGGAPARAALKAERGAGSAAAVPRSGDALILTKGQYGTRMARPAVDTERHGITMTVRMPSGLGSGGWSGRREPNTRDRLWKVGGVGTGLPGITVLLANPGRVPGRGLVAARRPEL